MAPNIKVALIQLYSLPLDPSINHTRAEVQIREASKDGAQLVVLPEYHLTSWAPHDPGFAECCRKSTGYLGKYQVLAEELSIAIVPGTIVEPDPDAPDGADLVNAAYFISPSGKILSRYQKKNLWHDERPHLVPDPVRHQAFDAEFGRGHGEARATRCRTGLLVCWDLAFPEAMRELVLDGAQLVICPAFWMADQFPDAEGRVINPDSEATFLNHIVVARAFESSAAVVFVNTGGPAPEVPECGPQMVNDEGVRYCGVSQVGMPLVGSLGRMGAEEATKLVDIDLATLEAAESAYRIRQDLTREGWHYGYSFSKADEVS